MAELAHSDLVSGDRVLLLTKDTALSAQMSALLKKRSCSWLHLPTAESALELGKKESFDLIVLDSDALDPTQASRLLSRLRHDPRFNRAPFLLLVPNSMPLDEAQRQQLGTDVQTTSSPLDPGDFLLKVSTQLRARKLRSEQANFDSHLSLQNAQLRDLTTRFNRELKEAQSIQTAILPKFLPEDPRCIFTASYLPLDAVAGDLFDIWEMPPDKFGLFIGDVTGHGLSAAFIGAMTKMALAYAAQPSPEKILAEMNRAMNPLMPDGRFVTVLAATFAADTGELRIARGGHPQPIILRASDGSIESPNPRGLALGFAPEAQYELFTTKLEPGDKLIIYTDGISEATDMDGAMFGSKGCETALLSNSPKLNVVESVEKILEAHEQFRGGRILKDDLTILGMEYLGPDSVPSPQI